MKPQSHHIPRRRDGRGNILPMRYSYTRPGVCADAEAIAETCELAVRDAEAAGGSVPLLRARHALRVSENAVAVREEIDQNRLARNEVASHNLEELEPKFETAREMAIAKQAQAIEACAGASCQLSEDGQRPVPVVPSPEAIASEHSFILRQPRSKLAIFLLKLSATVGSGTVFGISCGLLSGSLYLDDLSGSADVLVLWALLGTSIISLIGSTLSMLASDIGETQEWRSIRFGSGKRSFMPLAAFAAGLAITFVLIESQVEKLGMLRALREGQSFESFSVGETELFVVSLLLALPVVCWYLADGYSNAVKEVRRTFVLGEINARTLSVFRAQAFAVAARACAEASEAQKVAREFEEQIERLRASIRDEFTLRELEQIQDCEIDALAADWAAEDALLNACGFTQEARKERSRQPFLTRLLSRLFQRFREAA